jgi:excisionase family DNA binding protein
MKSSRMKSQDDRTGMEEIMDQRTRVSNPVRSDSVITRLRQADTKRFFTVSEVAELLRVSTRTVRRRINAGHLVAHRVGRLIRIAENDLRAFLASYREELAVTL